MKKNIILLFILVASGAIYSQSISLDSCKYLAIENNRKINEAILLTHESELVKKNAATKYFPKVMAGGVMMKANDYLLKEKVPEMNLPVYDGNPANILTATEFAYFPGMDLNILDYANIGYVAAVQPVYMGGRVRYGNKLASLGVEINEHKTVLTKEEVLISVEEQFWTLISLKEKMKTINSYNKMLDILFDEVAVAYKAGLAKKTDYLKVELKLNELRGKKLQLENGIDMMTRVICQNIGVEYSKNIDFAYDELYVNTAMRNINKSDSAYKNRQEYIMLKKAIVAEKLQKKVARGEFLPQFAVGVQGLYMDVIDKQTTNYFGFATINIPISDWWGGSYKLKEHQIRIEIAENNLAEKSELMALQTNNASNELEESFTQINIATKSVSQATEHLKIITDNYNAGLVNTSDMLEAQAMLQGAQDQLTDALCTNKIKQALYNKSRGIIN